MQCQDIGTGELWAADWLSIYRCGVSSIHATNFTITTNKRLRAIEARNTFDNNYRTTAVHVRIPINLIRACAHPHSKP